MGRKYVEPKPGDLIVVKNGVRTWVRRVDGKSPVGEAVAYLDNEHVSANHADAAEIVRRWNAFHDLVTACEDALASIVITEAKVSTSTTRAVNEATRIKLHDAIAKARAT